MPDTSRCPVCGDPLEGDGGQDCQHTGPARTKAQHTPGPWNTGTSGVGGKGLAICAGAQVIAEVLGQGYPLGVGSHPRSTANARLIAAAPEMLDLLTWLVEWQREPDRSDSDAGDIAVLAFALLSHLAGAR